jgi:RimJ/RimL family protein N-acetyltransferase
MQTLSEASAPEKERFYTELWAAAERCFITDKNRSPFQLGNLLAATEHYEEALQYYRHSQIETGDSPSTEFNLALTYLNLGRRDEARDCLANALSLEEDLTPARELLNKINHWSRVEPSKDGLTDDGQSNLSSLEECAFIGAQLKDQRLRLEPLLPIHAEALFQQATPEIMERTRLPLFSSTADALRWIRLTISDADNYTFAIMHRSSGLIGTISLDVIDETGLFFFWLGEPFWGQGLATAAASRLLRFVFDELGLEEMQTCVRWDNHPSLRVLRKLGFNQFVASDPTWLNFSCASSQFRGDEVTNPACSSAG